MVAIRRHTRRQRLNRALWVAALLAPASLGALWWPPMIGIGAALAVLAITLTPARKDAGLRYLDRVAGPLPRTALESEGRDDPYGLAAYVRTRGEQVVRATPPAPVALAPVGILAAFLLLGALLAVSPGLPGTVGRAFAAGLFSPDQGGLDPAGERVAPRHLARGSDLAGQGADDPQGGQPFTGQFMAPESDAIDIGTLRGESAERLVERLTTGRLLRPNPDEPGAAAGAVQMEPELERELQRRARDPESRRLLEEALERAYQDAPAGSEERRALDQARRRLNEHAEAAGRDPAQAGDAPQGANQAGDQAGQRGQGQATGEPSRQNEEGPAAEEAGGEGGQGGNDALGEGEGEGPPGEGAAAGLEGSAPVPVHDPRAALGRGQELFLRGERGLDGPTIGGVIRVAPGSGEIGSPLAGAPEEYRRVFEAAVTSDRLPAEYRDVVSRYFR